MPEDRLTRFLYLLMRDHLPTGVIAKLIEQINETGDREVIFSNKQLEAMASSYAVELIDVEAVTREMKIADESPHEHEVVK